jgi:hypothetical protein
MKDRAKQSVSSWYQSEVDHDVRIFFCHRLIVDLLDCRVRRRDCFFVLGEFLRDPKERET